MEYLSITAVGAMASGALSLVCLLTLHFVSPEFKPGWRMVSEYALGKHKWLLTLMFFFWSLCSFFTAGLLWHLVTTKWAMFGTILVFISGIGALMAALFDVKHKYHGLSFMLGIPTLPVGALIVSYHLIQNRSWGAHRFEILSSAHALWISVVLMSASMALLFSGFKKAGVPLDKNAAPPEKLPSGVVGVNGYFNRLLILCYISWTVVIACFAL
jgi:hypothetical protein